MSLQSLLKSAQATPNRGRFHIYLGDPLADGCDKTTVEAGNTFSPGVWTCGISVWIKDEAQEWLGTDMLQDEQIVWSFLAQPGSSPESLCRYHAGTIAVTSRLTHLGGVGSEGADFCEVALDDPARVAIVVKDVGPAGGKITEFTWDAAERALVINGTIQLMVEGEVAACEIVLADSTHDSPAVAIEMRDATPLRFKVLHGFANRAFAANIPRADRHVRTTVAEGFAQATTTWKGALPARVFAPDERVALAWERCAYHILAAMEGGLPRIGAVDYPVFWIRDGVRVLRALDLIGRHDLARVGCDYLAPLYFSGGFGAESDAPGEGIAALVYHALITHDRAWLKRVFPHIEERVRWIERLRTATAPLRAVTENRLPAYWSSPGSSIVCLAAKDGLINGRMDWHSPNFFINCWNAGGLRLAAHAAAQIGHADLAQAWRGEAIKYDDLIAAYLLPAYGNPRDPVIAPQPSGALAAHHEALKAQFASWFATHRLNADGTRQPERLWTYFEAAQAHNAFLMGLREEAWKSLDGMLAPTTATWDVGGYIEGEPNGNEWLPFGNGNARRGWLNEKTALGGNMPHHWASAEILHALRDAFVLEDGDQLVLGSGVPVKWFQPGGTFGVTHMPTALGNVSYQVTIAADGHGRLLYDGPQPYRLNFPGTVE